MPTRTEQLERTKVFWLRRTKCPVEKRFVRALHRRALHGFVALPPEQPCYTYDLGLLPVLPGPYAADTGERPAVIKRPT